MLHLAFIHFFVRFLSNLSRKGIRNNKKSDGHLYWFCFRHFTVLKDISTEYFIQMNKARLCCTLIIFSDGSLRMFLTLFRFLLLHSIPYANEKGCSKILSCRHTLRFTLHSTLSLRLRHIAKDCVLNAYPFCESMIVLSSQASDTSAFSGLLSTFVFISTCFNRIEEFSVDNYASEFVLCSRVLP